MQCLQSSAESEESSVLTVILSAYPVVCEIQREADLFI